MRPICFAIVLGLLGIAQPAVAQSEEPVRLVFKAPEGCLGEAEFKAEVRQHTRAVRFVETEAAARAVTAEITREGARYRGVLSVRESTGEPSARRFDDGDCLEVARSLALALAVAIDPSVIDSSGPALVEPASPPGKSAPAPSATASQPRVERAPRSPSDAVVQSTSAEPAWSSWHLGPLLFVESGVGPEIFVGVGVAGWWQLEPERMGLSPAVGLSALGAQSGIVSPDTPPARYRWLALRIAACPLSLGTAEVHARPCLVSDVGALTASGEDVDNPKSRTIPWWAAGVEGRVAFQLAKGVHLDASGDLALNLNRDRFLFEVPRTIVHEVPATSFGATLGVRFEL